jgi:alanine dehydrogenase
MTATLLLTGDDITRLVDPLRLARDLRAGFTAAGLSTDAPAIPGQRARTDLPGPGTATVLFPGLIPGVPAFTIKVQTKYPAHRPAIVGICCLCDLATGRLLAVLDAAQVTAWRTGMAGALAAHVLAPPDAARVAVIGAGVQGELQLRCLARLRPIVAATTYDLDDDRATELGARLSRTLGFPIQPAGALEAAVAGADILLVATWARRPLLTADLVRPGVHVTTLGADEPGKVEVGAEVLARALVVCDDRDLAVRVGALAGAGLGPEHVAATLAEVLTAHHPGRTSSEQITVYGGVGLPFMDLAVAWPVYQAAVERGVGTRIDLSATG